MYKAKEQSIRDSEKLANLSDFAYRVWDMALTASDLVGRITARPKKLWAQAMPLIPFDEARYTAALEELKREKLVHPYAVEGKEYMVFHDHEDHNKGLKNLRNLRASCPPPPPSLCYCIVYTKDEEEQEPVTAVIPAPLKLSAKEQNTVAHKLAALWNDKTSPGEHLNGKSAAEKIQAAIDVGVSPQDIEQAFWDHARIKGRKIWEILDPLRPKGQGAICSVDDVMKDWAKKGTA